MAALADRSFHAASRRWFARAARIRTDLELRLLRLALEWTKAPAGSASFDHPLEKKDWENTKIVLATLARYSPALRGYGGALDDWGLERVAEAAAGALEPSSKTIVRQTNTAAKYIRGRLSGAIAREQTDIVQQATDAVVAILIDQWPADRGFEQRPVIATAIRAAWQRLSNSRKTLPPHAKATSLLLAGLASAGYKGDPFVAERKETSRKSKRPRGPR